MAMSCMSEHRVYVHEHIFTPKWINVYVTRLGGRFSHSLRVLSTDVTEDLKLKICERDGIPPDQQRLIFNGKRLREGYRLAENGVQDGSKIMVIYPLRNSIGSIIVEPLDGPSFSVEVELRDKVEDIKSVIHHKMGIQTKYQILRFEGRQLEDHRRLSDYAITRESVLQLELCRPSNMTVSIYIPTKKFLELPAELNDTIRSVKHKIEKEENIASCHQSLEFLGRCLNDERTLFQCGIKNGSMLTLRPQREAVIPVRVYLSASTWVEFQAPLSSTIHELKKIVQERKNIPCEKQILKLNGKILFDEKTLSEYEIKKGTAPVELKCFQNIKINVVLPPTNRRITLKTESSVEIHKLKKRLCVWKDYPINQQQLQYGGEKLRDNSTLFDYNIQNESILYMAIRQPTASIGQQTSRRSSIDFSYHQPADWRSRNSGQQEVRQRNSYSRNYDSSYHQPADRQTPNSSGQQEVPEQGSSPSNYQNVELSRPSPSSSVSGPGTLLSGFWNTVLNIPIIGDVLRFGCKMVMSIFRVIFGSGP